jgi:hypothetical protein
MRTKLIDNLNVNFIKSKTYIMGGKKGYVTHNNKLKTKKSLL